MKSKLSELFKAKLDPDVAKLPLPIVKEILQNLLSVSPHRATKILNNPEKVNGVELPLIARWLDIPCWVLLDTHGIGMEGVPPILKEHHQAAFMENQTELARA